jgi:hypothetical protein
MKVPARDCLFLNFSNVSNIDHRLRNSEAYADSITAPPWAAIGDRESVMLPPNAGKHHARIATILDRY